ncbi:MAG: hypothetical protein ACLTDV_03850 [Eubacterium sp.]
MRDTVYQEAVEHSPVYTYGPIIHNEEVIADLKRKGVQVILICWRKQKSRRKAL